MTEPESATMKHDYADWPRLGNVSFDVWWDTVLNLDATLEEVETDVNLPIGPNKDIIEALSVNVHLSMWGSRLGEAES
jgi:hypothetical protein